MKDEIISTIKKVFELGVSELHDYGDDDEKIALIDSEVMADAFSDTPLEIDHCCDLENCVAYVVVDDIKIATSMKFNEVLAHNLKPLKEAEKNIQGEGK